MPAETETIAGLVRRQAEARGSHPLLVCDDDRLSYAEAQRRSTDLARGLVALGAGKGTHVGLLHPNGSDFVVGLLAIARIGAVVVPFTTFATAPELREQLVHSDVTILLATSSYRGNDFAQRLSDIRESAPLLRHALFDTLPPPGIDETLLTALEADVDGSDPLAIVYTSGSTAAPKGVLHTQGALLEHQRNLNTIRGLTAHDILFCNSPFFWIGGLAFGLLATLVAGSTLVCSNATEAYRTLDLLEAQRPTMTNGFVAGIAHLARDPHLEMRDLSSMRRGNLYPVMAPEVRPRDPELRHNMLGLTEAGGVVLISGDESDQPEHRRGSFGKPAPGFETQIDEHGELCIRGPYVMQRYHKRSREECFDADGWFDTGDLVRVDADGFYYFVGRRGSMIKTAGANVAPAEVEKALVRISGGATAYAFGIPDSDRGEAVVAVIATDDPIDEASLQNALKRELSAYKIPKRIVAVPPAQIPALSSGKVDMKRLAAMFDG
ncbi:class I adenylate-forming enzyme family protein [Mycobacterium sp. ITM-2016-00318]|uniref:class I adenylate-forming enzyme family protein n=1 Tax=Mycobacterium sp. ITM-2016-00318 TaxID=2099693 RepID=UPI000CF88A94|nr:class I adenylate-forming enzyme family protein [Mycobacterium sp. ITM-2016-00318]WNG94555.1 class I adenylate-forming enzyme family protein [Mycobacterium sp. ITM-2016-00318]